jgi:pimeloyl-ACP methyl ester carboxylesterase
VRVATHHTFSQPQIKAAVQGATATGTAVAMSHALGLDLHMWDELASQLAANHPVLRYDHRGHGGSAVPVGPYTMDDLVDDAARLIREWGRGPVVWIGLSMGGMVAQGLALRYPELVKAVVLANTSAKYPGSLAGGLCATRDRRAGRRHGSDRRFGPGALFHRGVSRIAAQGRRGGPRDGVAQRSGGLRCVLPCGRWCRLAE